MFLNEDEQAAKYILNNKFVGNQAEIAVQTIRDCPVKRATLCVTSDPEMDKCIKMRVGKHFTIIFTICLCSFVFLQTTIVDFRKKTTPYKDTR